jgi:hypothetical protein
MKLRKFRQNPSNLKPSCSLILLNNFSIGEFHRKDYILSLVTARFPLLFVVVDKYQIDSFSVLLFDEKTSILNCKFPEGDK